MKEKLDPLFDLLTHALGYLWVLLLAMMGGAVSYFQRVKDGKTRFKWRALCIELLTSGFTGLLTLWICQAAGMSLPITAFMIGISGHMGTRAVFKMEALYNKLLGETP